MIYEEDKFTNKDHVATPRYVVEDIYSLIDIKSFNNIWFPFNNYDSEFKLKADELKLKYKATHIFDDLGNDFFQTEPPQKCELLISNPPFGLQNKIVERTFKLVEEHKVKSFALLLPLSTLETPTRGEMYEKHVDELSVIIFKKRIKFLGKEHSFNKGCCWICYNIPSLNKKLYWI
ncbi:MAG: sugar-phosphate nucleotidyltransferase [Bacilli bacterium]|jgi:hypothetical protein|nr:sugar-phosphate nucleotidyltransferase [Bacilli bacterium]